MGIALRLLGIASIRRRRRNKLVHDYSDLNTYLLRKTSVKLKRMLLYRGSQQIHVGFLVDNWTWASDVICWLIAP